MRDIQEDHRRFMATGRPFGRAVVTSVWGSAPRPAGACLLADAAGRIAGSVSGGCVEGATATAIAQALDAGSPKLVEFGVSDEQAWEVGLACGGTIRILVEPEVRQAVARAAAGPGGVAIATLIEGPGDIGAALVIDEREQTVEPVRPAGHSKGDGGAALLDEERSRIVDTARHALRRGTSTTETFETQGQTFQVFLEVFPRQPTLVVFGGVHIAAVLVPMARLLGYRTVVADGRASFLTRERFPQADELILGWPDEAFRQVELDSAAYVCVLTHDPKFDDPALEIALRSNAAYVGAIGSRKTQKARRARLEKAGLSDQELDRLRGPIGLDLGGREPGEIALAILAEMTAVRYGASGGPRA